MRRVPEWIGKTDDTPAPARVKMRVFERDLWTCRNCSRPVTWGDKPEADHITAIINDGANRETNLQTLCSWCHSAKTAQDVAIKAKTYKHHKARAGIRGRGSFPTNKSGPFKKTFRHGTVRRER